MVKDKKGGLDKPVRPEDIRYRFISPAYAVDRVCQLYYLANASNELAGLLKEKGIEFVIGGSSALGTALNVTSDYMRRRTSCDVDLFVRKKDYRKIDELFQEAGWLKYDESECGLIREYVVDENGKREVVDEYPNIKDFVVYHKIVPEYNVDFLVYMSSIGKYSMKRVKKGRLVEDSGYNRSAEESFVHKIFRGARRDRSDFLAVSETDGLHQILEDKYGLRTFKEYLKEERHKEHLYYLMDRLAINREKYWNMYAMGRNFMKRKAQEKNIPETMRVTIHYQTIDVPTDSAYFDKLMIGCWERVWCIDESLRLLEELLIEG